MIFLLQDRLIDAVPNEAAGQSDVIEVWTEAEAASIPALSEIAFQPISVFLRARLCKAEVHPDHLCGAFCVHPKGKREHPGSFFYALWKDRILFVDNSGTVLSCLRKLQKQKSWCSPSTGMFFYDFMETVIANDLSYLTTLEDRIAQMEDEVLAGELDHFNHRMLGCRREILLLSHYYSKLSDIGMELQENENGIFDATEQRCFKLFTERVSLLRQEAQMLREYSAQVREAYQAQIDIRQNKIMKVLTVVTTIFMPLSLIAGWYGMNFCHMPELGWRYGYPAIIILSVAVVLFCLWIFKRKKFM